MRKLVTVRRISEIKPIEGADKIELAILDGWQVVVKKGEYQANDLALYCEIDSFIPQEVAPFLVKKEPREFEGILGERLRTIKLRGEISQGLLLPISTLLDKDISSALGVIKYEKPLDRLGSFKGGQPKGNFPEFIPKTDEERIQNIKNYEALIGQEFVVSEKLDGTSFTVYFKDGEVGVCSRNLDLKEGDSLYWSIAKKYDLIENLKTAGVNMAIQGEIIGPRIQGNSYKLDEATLFVFNMYDIDNRRYFSDQAVNELCKSFGLTQVPEITDIVIPGTREELLKLAEGKSILNQTTDREGLVFKTFDRKFSFKVISNKWLLGEKD